MYVLNGKRFRQAMKEIFYTVLTIAAVIWFCVFIYQHSGLDIDVEDIGTEAVREYVTYEYVVQSDEENPRVKTAVPQKVVYRVVEK